MPYCNVDDDVANESVLSIDVIDPLAVAAYLGDLYNSGYLSGKLLKTCMTFMLDNFRSLSHLHCIEVILERANSHPVC